MSRAEELANFLEFHFTEYERCHPNDAPMCESAAAELRRLAQVEAEHAALLKAISDAEPVAWLVGVPEEPELGHWLTENKYDETYSSTPLYTLNGIKKP